MNLTIHLMSCFDTSLDTRDSELLPCSCSASWKLHSMAINVLGSSEEEKIRTKMKLLVFVFCFFKQRAHDRGGKRLRLTCSKWRQGGNGHLLGFWLLGVWCQLLLFSWLSWLRQGWWRAASWQRRREQWEALAMSRLFLNPTKIRREFKFKREHQSKSKMEFCLIVPVSFGLFVLSVAGAHLLSLNASPLLTTMSSGLRHLRRKNKKRRWNNSR